MARRIGVTVFDFELDRLGLCIDCPGLIHQQNGEGRVGQPRCEQGRQSLDLCWSSWNDGLYHHGLVHGAFGLVAVSSATDADV